MTLAFRQHTLRMQLGMAALLVGIVFVAMMLTSHAITYLRVAIPLLGRLMGLLEESKLPFDMAHVAFFSAMTFAARLLLPRLRWWWIALAVAVLAVCTELMQFWVPGRTPKLLDTRDDMIGGALGLTLASVLMWLACMAQECVRMIGQRNRDAKPKAGVDE